MPDEASAHNAAGGGRTSPAELRRVLGVFHDKVLGRVVEHSEFLQAVVYAAHAADGGHPIWEADEAITRRVERLGRRIGLKAAEVDAVADFLADFRAQLSLKPVRYNGLAAGTAHHLAFATFLYCARVWASSIVTAGRSQTESGYLYQATAAQLFYRSYVASAPSRRLVTCRRYSPWSIARQCGTWTAAPPRPPTLRRRPGRAWTT